MDDPNKGGEGGGAGEGGGTPPAGTQTKTPEQRIAELEATITKMGGQFQANAEELKRVNGMNQALIARLNKGGGEPSGGGMTPHNTVKLKRDFSQLDPSQDPNGFATALVEEAAEKVREVVVTERVQAQNAEQLRNAFFTANKDLVGFEREVGSFAQEVQMEMPHLPWAEANAEVAKRTREYLKSRGYKPNDTPNPPNVVPGSNSNSGEGGGPPMAPKGGGYDPAKDYADSMKDYAEERDKERGKTGMKG